MNHLALLALALTASLHPDQLQPAFEQIAAGIDGRVGVCAQDRTGAVCANGDQRFSLQSVMKLLAGLAAMDAVDRRGWRLDEPVTVRQRDLSLFVQPIAKLVTATGYRTTVGDLVRRAIVDSDSAASDILMARLGGAAAVQSFLDRKDVKGIRVDRDEKRLQTEILGLTWRPEYVDAAVFDRALDAVPKERRDRAYRRYRTDVRDTATPRGMADLLHRLAAGKLLTAASTAHILQVMTQTVTFPDRLRAGVPSGWTLGHKTGTSGTWNSITAATNDVGVLRAPDGGYVAIVVLIGDSRAAAAERARAMAKLAAATAAQYR
jgi:beta-lactamase class A